MPFVASPVTPPSPSDAFPTHVDTYGRGGYRSVAEYADLAAIPSERRKAGMLVGVYATSDLYVLAADLVTWVDAYAPALSSEGTVEYTVPYSSPTHTILSLPLGVRVVHVAVFVDVPWDGAGASLAVGTVDDAAALSAVDDLDVSTPGIYAKDVYGVSGPAEIVATVVPGVGATAGSAVVRMFLAS